MDKKVHYKMHKVKKQWVTIAVTGMSLGAVSAVFFRTNDGVVQADEHTDATVAIPDITVDTGTVSNDTTAAQDPTTAVAATNDVATDQAAPTATFDLTTDTTNTVAANAVDTAATVGTDRAATTTDTATNIQLLIQQITILQLTQQQLLIAQRHVNVVRLVLDVVLQEAVVLPQLTAIQIMPTILSQ